MNNPLQKNHPQWLPYIAAIAIFYIITLIYFIPALEGKKIKSSDMISFRGVSKEIVDYRNKTGEEALWTNGMFGGMPAYQISTKYTLNLMRYVDKVLKFGFSTPIGTVFMYFLGFYLLLIVLRVNPWLSIPGAIAFAFSSYFFIILEAGHNSKAAAIGYMAPVLAGVVLAYRGRILLGGALTALFLALEILSGHPQITYYLLIMVLIYGITELIRHAKEQALPAFFRATGVLAIAAGLAVLTHVASLWGTYEYSKYTIRSKSELTHDADNRTTGLDKDYATSWSYGVPESMTLLIPNFHGGSSHASLSRNSATYEVLRNNRIQGADDIIESLPMYWGPQPFTSGPVYAGAIMVFLFIFSLFILKGPLKWWGVAVAILSLMLAWGKHFMGLTGFFLDHVPLYNKFRTVSMILVMAELVIPLMGILAVGKLVEGSIDKKKAFKSLQYSLAITGSVLLFFLILGGSLFSFSSPQDSGMGLPEWLMDAIRQDRRAMFRNDTIRSLLFILVTSGVLWAFMTGKLKKGYLFAGLSILILADMAPVARRYLNGDDFERKAALENPFPMTKADQSILRDKDLSYRVYNLGEAFDQSARTSFFHKNVGGYHGAKFRRYQELVDFHLAPERTRLVNVLNSKPTQESVENVLKGMNTFNMLNTRYFIYNNDAEPLKNTHGLGNAWFVDGYILADNADAEIVALASLQPDSLAVIDKSFSEFLEGVDLVSRQGAKISLIEYSPRKLVYNAETTGDLLAVFSEVYYDKGWNAYIDGQRAPHFRANYLLRSMVVPGGRHTIEFRFEPKSYFTGQKVSLLSSGIILLLLAALAYLEVRKRRASR
jgi:hypothetical protein